MRPVAPLKAPRGAGPALLPLRRTAGLVALSALPATVAQSGALTPQRVLTQSLVGPVIVYVATGMNGVNNTQSVVVPAGARTMTIECVSEGRRGYYAIRQRVPVHTNDAIVASAGAPGSDDGYSSWSATGSYVTVNSRVLCSTPAGPLNLPGLVVSDPFGVPVRQSKRPVAGLAMALAPSELFLSDAPFDGVGGGCVAITFEG